MSRSIEELRDEQQALDQKVADLDTLGWSSGAGTLIWARVMSDALELHDKAREEFGDGEATEESWERVHGHALVIVVAIDQILDFERRVRQITGDADLKRSRDEFVERVPRVTQIRNVAAHLADYAIGQGNRQQDDDHRDGYVLQRNVAQLPFWTDDGVYLDLGGDQVNLKTASDAAMKLAGEVERVRVKHMKLLGDRANALIEQQRTMLLGPS